MDSVPSYKVIIWTNAAKFMFTGWFEIRNTHRSRSFDFESDGVEFDTLS